MPRFRGGIGLALIGAVLAKQSTLTVIATVRVTSSASDLLALQMTCAGRLEIVTKALAMRRASSCGPRLLSKLF